MRNVIQGMLGAVLAIVFALVVAGCSTIAVDKSRAPYVPPELDRTHFMVISDTHLYSRTLGTTGKAWQEYLSHDRKLLGESEELLKAAIALIIERKPRFLIISGDLTKDGEKSNHLLLAQYLDQIRDAGIQVYVVPGNHDINNPHALAFGPKGTTPVDSVSPAEFAEIYADFGFKQAYTRDSASLSYAVECAPGLVLLAIDSCRYENNYRDDYPETDGGWRPGTFAWLQKTIAEGQKARKAFILTQHHGVVEHFKGANTYMNAFIMDDFQNAGVFLRQAGVPLAFTGHAHSQDITMGEMIDVETGSLVSYPSAVREVVIEGRKASISSRYIDILGDYAKTFTKSGITGFAYEKATKTLGLSPSEADIIARQAGEAFLAHFSGDEPPGVKIEQVWDKTGLGLWGRLIADILEPTVLALYTDLAPPDNSTEISW